MRKRNSLIRLALLGFYVFGVGGCVPGDFFASTHNDSKKIAATNLRAIADHDANMTRHHKFQTPEVSAAIVQSSDTFAEEIADNRRALAAIKSGIGVQIEKLLAPGKALIAQLTMGFPLGQQSIAGFVQNEDRVAGVKVTNAMADMDRENDADVAALRKDLEAKWSALEVTTRQKFEAVSADRAMAIREMQVTEAERREAVFREAKLTDAEKEDLKSFSTEQLLMMLGGLGVAGGAGGAFGRGGRANGTPKPTP